MRGAVYYTDGQLEDDARLVIALARTAAAHGADVLTRCAATDLREDRLTLTDETTGESVEARGTVVSATGVWAGEHDPSLRISPSRGSHLVVRAEALGCPSAVFTAPVPGHFGRFVFALPQSDGLVLVGLTDDAAPGVDGIAPPVPESDEDFLLATINRALERPLTRQDVVGRFAGLRPLVLPTPSGGSTGGTKRRIGRHGFGERREHGASGDLSEGAERALVEAGATADVSRRHLLIDEPGRPLTIAGGKLTTYRTMAEDAVDAACRRLGTDRECRTRTLPLVGAAPREVLARLEEPTRLVRRYGTEAGRVAELGRRYPRFAGPVAGGVAYTGAEMLFGVLAEGALTVEDLVERRTRTSFVESAVPAAREVAAQVLELATTCPPPPG